MNHSPYGKRGIRTTSPLKYNTPTKKVEQSVGHIPPFLEKTLHDYQLLEYDQKPQVSKR